MTARKMTNYPNGHKFGATIRNVPIASGHPGNIFWVDSGVGGNGNKGTWDDPWADVDYAIGRCTANNGDIIYVKPGHAESITANDAVDVDVAGVTVICLGNGDLRPTFTWDGTDATACIAMAAADTAWFGGLFISSDAGDDITGMFRVEADDVELGYLTFQEGTGQPECAILLSDGADRYNIHHCRATSLTNGAAANDSFVTLNAASTGTTGGRIQNNEVHGTYDQACIWCTDATAAQTDLIISDNILINTASSLYAIDLTSGTNVTGMITGNVVETDAEATSIRGGGATLVNNHWGLNTLQSASPGQAYGAQLTSVAPGMIITSTTADEIATVTSGGPIVVNSIIGVSSVLAEAEAAAVFDNIVTGSSGNLYSADQETALQDSAFEVGDYVVFDQAGPTVVEAASSQTEDSRGLNWLIQASDTIDIEGGSAAAEGTATVIINYTSLGGELEVEAV